MRPRNETKERDEGTKEGLRFEANDCMEEEEEDVDSVDS
jgi:hypothetical protein